MGKLEKLEERQESLSQEKVRNVLHLLSILKHDGISVVLFSEGDVGKENSLQVSEKEDAINIL